MVFQFLISLCYLYQSDLYLGVKVRVEKNLGTGEFFKKTESLENSHCMVFFDNFFNSPSLTVKLYERGLYGIGTAWKDKKGMPEMPVEKKISRSHFKYLYSDKVACCKWLDRRSVTLLFSNVEGMAKISYCSPPAKRISVKNPSTLPIRHQNVRQRNGWC